MRFGTELRITQYSRQVSGRGGMRLTFSRGFTQKDFNRGDPQSGNAMASFLLGAPSGGQVDFNVFPIYMWKYIAPWVQDDWKITRKLTLNLGLRWDFNRPLRERFDRMNYVFDANAVNPVSARIDKARFPGLEVKGGLRFAGVDGNPREPWKFDGNNIQPRVGAVYELDDRTVRRGRHPERPVRGELAHGLDGVREQRKVRLVGGGHPIDHGIVDLRRLHRHTEAVVHVARPLLRAHAHHVGGRAVVPCAAAVAHDLLTRRVPHALRLDQHAVEIEHDRRRFAHRATLAPRVPA